MWTSTEPSVPAAKTHAAKAQVNAKPRRARPFIVPANLKSLSTIVPYLGRPLCDAAAEETRVDAVLPSARQKK
ncbi:MAG: hypothetical protein AAFU79_29975, partial [Myxococcota bacterium]